MDVKINEEPYIVCYLWRWGYWSRNGYDLNWMFLKLIDEYEKWGLEINMTKTQYMVKSAEGDELQRCN